MELREIDKVVYKQKQRKVGIVFSLIFAVIGLGLSAVLRHYYGNAEGENMMVNLTGVLIGLAISIIIFTQVAKKPYFDELRYGWNLKKQALKIQNHRHRWEERLKEGDTTAAIVLAFYHKATLQLQSLDGNEFGYSDSKERENKFLVECEKLSLDPDASKYSIDMLLDMK
ncbi:DUF3087 family protein [Neptuniibacter sp. QD48_11]|uniref:DUF3087 family protein n=1 Tax=unclassified Neptuniibacter TaxID=2630693 RepID=UPI0039F60980